MANGRSIEQDHHDRDHHVVVVMVPLAAQGHLNQLLHLSRLIAAYDIPVHYVGTTTHNRQAKLRIHGWDPNKQTNLHFHNFTIPPFPSPPPNATSSPSTKFPSHLMPSFVAANRDLREPLTKLLLSLSSNSKRVIIIHDSLMVYPVEQGMISLPNIESYNFHSVSAFTIALLELELRGLNDNSIPKELKIPSLDGCFTPEFWEFVGLQFNVPKRYSGNLYNTCKLLEKPYWDILEKINHDVKNWAIGPFNPVKDFEKKPSEELGLWLDRQEPKSVIYISFGTTTAMEEEQIKELANGLERSKQKFIWVLRDADKGDVFEKDVIRNHELPEGFEKRVVEEEKRGIIIRDWAPQLEILRHKSTGGFMTHCGWNSCMESLTMGIPIVGWPMHSDQPRNAVLMSEVLRVGVVVREWECREEIVDSTTVENVVRKLMMSEEGREMRKKAEEIGDVLRRSVDDGGVSRLELDSFIAHILR